MKSFQELIKMRIVMETLAGGEMRKWADDIVRRESIEQKLSKNCNKISIKKKKKKEKIDILQMI